MATVLISFVGRPPFKEKSNREYTPTNYRFGNDSAFDISASFFGVALSKNLISQNRDVKRWLLMGTHQSIWQTLLEAIPQENQECLSEIYSEITDEVAIDGFVKAETLQKWEASLVTATNLQIICRLVGDGGTKESQENIWRAIDEAVEKNDKIVVDITHGLRHQPIIASFMVMFLRWAKNIERIEMFYGALELANKDENFCPVLELPICNELLKASEAVSNNQQTGNFIKLGESLSLNSNDVEKIAFSNEMNRSDKGKASIILADLEKKSSSYNSIKNSLKPLMKEALDWQNKSSIVYVYQRKAETSFKHKQYFQAIALLWEALSLAGCKKFGITIRNPNSFNERKDAVSLIKENLAIDNKDTFIIIEYLRNAIMHGSDCTDRTYKQKVDKALTSQNDFINRFKEGQNLLKFFLQ